MTDHRSDYLWDRSGEPDPEVQHLEEILGGLRHRGSLPVLPGRPAQPAKSGPGSRTQRSHAVPRTHGCGNDLSGRGRRMVRCRAAAQRMGRGAACRPTRHRRQGRRRERAAACGERGSRRARPERRASRSGEIGRVDVDPNTRLQLVEARGREHRMALEKGTIHAQIWAPPKFFVVDTPSAVATDLGCAYTLKVDASGAGLVRVTSGWVGFEFKGRESFIPQEAVCATRPGVGPGTPYYEDAPSGYAAALTILDFGPPGDAARARGTRDRALVGAETGRAHALAPADSRHDRRASSGLRSHGGARATAAGRHKGGRAARRSPRYRSLVECARPRQRVLVEAVDAAVVKSSRDRDRDLGSGRPSSEGARFSGSLMPDP